ncbi:MATE family efflux transporter [Halalkaliarchaeum sp. AArc-GB]|uniref:MATE family efflux transporter n=1 Tax=Halalkaliarchaeum sp. AArc-GB TaxID=3074078 RepID=UPI00285CAF2A|nr:MATE family efflux transporter [Halalkaliarchaeum sp. AArc-GB]MDR5673862.1 MATE family efflux transporter [Halalkaliarchaeum sp. AArc-GB]
MSLRDLVGYVFRGREQIDLVSGSIGKPLFFLSLPLVLTNLFQVAYNLADTFWLGQYSTNALAAISFAWPPVFLLLMLGMGIAVAGSVLVAQYTGAEEHRTAEYAASQTVVYALIGSFLIGGTAYLAAEPLLFVLGASPEVLPLATGYLEVVSLGFVFMFGFMVFNSLMRGYGETITPMLVMFGTVVLNIVLDPFVIFGWGPFPELGILGAAYATVFSRALGLSVGMYIMVWGDRGVTVNLTDMVPDLSFLERILRIGAPAAVEGVSRAISQNLLLFVVGWFATPVVAGYGIATRVFSLVFLPAVAVDRGVETMSGQNLGAGKPDRAGASARIAAVSLFGLMSVVGVVVWIGARPIAGLFTPDPAVVDAASEFMRYVAPTFGFIGIMRAYSGSLCGAGKTLTVAGIAIVMLGILRFPIAWGTAGVIGETGIWIAFAISNVGGAAVAYLWYQRGTWREGDLTDQDHDVGSDSSPATD